MSDPEQITAEVFGFFESKGTIPGANRQEQLQFNYLDSGFINSMDIVELVTHLESRLQVQFGPDDFQSQEFRTLEGLIRILSQKTSAGGSR